MSVLTKGNSMNVKLISMKTNVLKESSLLLAPLSTKNTSIRLKERMNLMSPLTLTRGITFHKKTMTNTKKATETVKKGSSSR